MICLYCRKDHDPAVGRLCAHCGIAVLPPTPEKEEPQDDRPRRCAKCGVPVSVEATRCRACGEGLPEIEEPSGPALIEPGDSLRELELPPGPRVEVATGPVAMAPAPQSPHDVDLPPGPPVELARGPVRTEPPELHEVELE